MRGSLKPFAYLAVILFGIFSYLVWQLGSSITLDEKTRLFLISVELIASLLVVLVVYLAISGERRARELADEMSNDLLLSQEWFRELYDTGPVPYLVLLADGRINRPNKAALRLYGGTAEELEGKNLLMLLAEEERAKGEQHLEYFRRGLPIDGQETQIIRKDGSLRWVILSILILARNEGKHTGLVTLVDITERKNVERAKTEFVSLASHQLRSPLSVMKWMTGALLSGDVGVLGDKQQQYVQKVSDANQRMIDLVELLLNVSRIEMGSLVPRAKDVNVVELSDKVIEELSLMAAEKKITIRKDFGDVHSMHIDPKLLDIVFQNLLSNAIKYTPEGGEVSVSFTHEGGSIRIIVSDTGFGIPPKDYDKVFTKLFRAENVMSHDVEGTGLGVYLVKSVVDVLGGKISFTSELNKGTTFTVVLPSHR